MTYNRLTFCITCLILGVSACSSDDGESSDAQPISDMTTQADMASLADLGARDMFTVPPDMSKTPDMVAALDQNSSSEEMASEPDLQEKDASMEDMAPDRCPFTCDMVDFVATPGSAQTAYDATTKTVTLYVDTSPNTITEATLDGMILRERMVGNTVMVVGENFAQKGSVQDGVLTFDLSEVEIPQGFDLRTDSVDVTLSCGESKSLQIKSKRDPLVSGGSSTFTCEPPLRFSF